jgi:hypothetical protein
MSDKPPKGNYNKAAEPNRAEEIRRDTDEQQDRSIKLEDVDKAILYQFKERFDTTIVQNGERRSVPIIFDHPERWKWAARQDVKSAGDNVLYPLLVVTRESTDTDTARDNPNKQFFNMSDKGGNFVAKQRWSQKNRYDNFAALEDRKPSYEYYLVQIPSYIDVSYSVKLYTEYRIHANNLQERFQYEGRSYWGDPERWLFWCEATSFSQNVEQPTDDAKYVETSFDVQVKAYILPDESLKQETLEKMHTISEVDFEEKITTKEDFLNDNH